MTRFEKWAVLSSSLVTGATGVAYLYVKYAMEPVDPWAVINHPAQPWLLKAHIVTAPFLVFAVGMIALRHIWRHYRTGMQWGRRTGILSGLSLLPMILTGYLIQGVTHELWLQVMVWTHIITSVVFLISVTVHAVVLARILARSGRVVRAREVGVPQGSWKPEAGRRKPKAGSPRLEVEPGKPELGSITRR